MKKIVAILFLISIFGCRTQKNSETISNSSTIETIRDTIVTIVEKHDTFYVYLPKIINEDSVVVKKKTSSLFIKKKTGSSLMIVCHEDELKLKLDSVIRSKVTILKEKTIVKVEKCNSKFHIFCTYFSVIAICMLFLIMIIKK